MSIIVRAITVVATTLFMFAWDTFAWGYVCFQFWRWFILPVFPELPHISYMEAIGIMFFIVLFKNRQSVLTKTEEEKNRQLIQFLVSPILLLCLGFLFS